MPDTLVAQARAVAGPETLSNGGKKYSIVLDNGSMLCTFSEKCADVLGKHLDSLLSFDVEIPDKPGMSPKILKVTNPANGETLWEPSQGGGGGRTYDSSTELAKHAVGTAGAVMGNVLASRPTVTNEEVKAAVLYAMTEIAPLIHAQLKELKAQG